MYSSKIKITTLSNFYIFIYILLLTLSFSDRLFVNYNVVKYFCLPYLITGIVHLFRKTCGYECHRETHVFFIFQFLLCLYALAINILKSCDSLPLSILITVLTGYLLVFALTPFQRKLVLIATFIGGFLLSFNIVYNGIEVIRDDQNANSIGHVIYLAFLCGILIVNQITKSFFKLFIILGLLIIFYSTLLIGSRQTFLVCTFISIVFLFPLIKEYKLLSICIFVLFLLFLGEKIIEVFSDSHLYSRLTENKDDSRLFLIFKALDLFQERPIFGYGFGEFQNYTPFVYTHNTPTELLFSGGVIAFVLYYFMYIKLSLKYFFRSFSKKLYNSQACVVIVTINVLFIVAGQFFIMFNSSLAYILYFQILNQYLLNVDYKR